MPPKPRLEVAIRNILWDHGELSARDVLALLDNNLAYTTVATVLDRMYKKELASRHKHLGSWLYTSTNSREQAVAADAARILSRHGDEPTLLAFVERVEKDDPELLDRLEALIQARKGEP